MPGDSDEQNDIADGQNDVQDYDSDSEHKLLLITSNLRNARLKWTNDPSYASQLLLFSEIIEPNVPDYLETLLDFFLY